jgi:hypothetical protein
MMERKGVMTRMFVHILRGMESREPTRNDWETGKTVQQALEVPCRLVVKAQDKGHWLLSDAIHRICQCFAEHRVFVRNATRPSERSSPDVMGQHDLNIHMRETFMAHMRPFLMPFLGYSPQKAHAALAVLCDPRLRRGEVFYWMCDPITPQSEKLQHHQSVMEQYTVNHLIPFMVRMRMGELRKQQPAQQEGDRGASQEGTNVGSEGNAPQESIFDVPDNLLDGDDTEVPAMNEGHDSNHDLHERLMVEARFEVKRFRAKDAVKGDVQPLKWWRENQRTYPMLAPVVRIVLSCPSSQIECERVFSLCGATVALLRNRMSTDNLAQNIYVSKSTYHVALLKSLLQEANGQLACDKYLMEPCNNPKSETSAYMEVEDGLFSSNADVQDDEDTETIWNSIDDWDEVVEAFE